MRGYDNWKLAGPDYDDAPQCPDCNDVLVTRDFFGGGESELICPSCYADESEDDDVKS